VKIWNGEEVMQEIWKETHERMNIKIETRAESVYWFYAGM
jgi:hypothetical protein